MRGARLRAYLLAHPELLDPSAVPADFAGLDRLAEPEDAEIINHRSQEVSENDAR